MNRKELCQALEVRTGVAYREVDRVIGGLIEEIPAQVRKDNAVSLTGFGTFERRSRKARTARNVRSGEPVRVPATKVPAFKAGLGFREIVAGKRPAPKPVRVRAATTGTTGTVARSRSRAGATLAKGRTATPRSRSSANSRRQPRS